METREAAVPVGSLKPGETGTIVGLSGGRSFTARCLALGCIPGTEIQMERNAGRGPVVVVVRGVRLALGRDESMRLTVAAQDSEL
ncbi:MAG: ferrous iron transport protein A [Dehalococcoidia bacterium]